MSYTIHYTASEVGDFFTVDKDGNYNELRFFADGGSDSTTLDSLDNIKGLYAKGWTDNGTDCTLIYYITNNSRNITWGINNKDWHFLNCIGDYGQDGSMDGITVNPKTYSATMSGGGNNNMSLWAEIPYLFKYPPNLLEVKPKVILDNSIVHNPTYYKCKFLNYLTSKQYKINDTVKLVEYPFYFISNIPDCNAEITSILNNSNTSIPVSVFKDKLIIDISGINRSKDQSLNLNICIKIIQKVR